MILRKEIFFAAVLLVALSTHAKLIAHYDFNDGDLLDNELGPAFRLEQCIGVAGTMAGVLLNRTEGTAVFFGGADSIAYLQAKGLGQLDGFAASFWFRTDGMNEQLPSAGLFSSGTPEDLESRQIQNDEELLGILCLQPDLTTGLCETYKPKIWHHVVVLGTQTSTEVYITPETDTVGSPVFKTDRSLGNLNEIVLGADRSKTFSFRMEMANVKIHDSSDISVSK